MPAHGALGEDQRPCAAPLFQRPGDDLFRVAQPIDGGRVDPVDAQFERAMNGGDGLVVVLRSPGELPVPAADGPRAKPDRRQLQIRIAKCVKLRRTHGLRMTPRAWQAQIFRPAIGTQVPRTWGPGKARCLTVCLSTYAAIKNRPSRMICSSPSVDSSQILKPSPTTSICVPERHGAPVCSP